MTTERERKSKTLSYRVTTGTLKALTRILCRVDDAQMERVPQHGPLIVIVNHINFMEVPLLATHLLPRPVFGLAKAESWDNPFLKFLWGQWEAIPVARGEADTSALRQCLEVLERGDIMMLAPEGTRSGHGRLQRAQAGVAFIALRSGAPMIPVVHYGGEAFWDNFRRLRRTDFHIVVGHPFCVDDGGVRADQSARQQMTAEIMYQMAALLPEQNRGVYSDLSAATEHYLRFPPGSQSNLTHAST
jgi:1-acyl-sn-glycerol-3-phosphate acyltransferase